MKEAANTEAVSALTVLRFPESDNEHIPCNPAIYLKTHGFPSLFHNRFGFIFGSKLLILYK